MRVVACVVLALVASTASAQDATEYHDLRTSRPDGRKITVKDLRLERDVYSITLSSGAIHLLAPLGKDTFGAVFIGEGEYVLNPATSSERRHLQLVTNNKPVEDLKDGSTKLLFFFPERRAAEREPPSTAVRGPA